MVFGKKAGPDGKEVAYNILNKTKEIMDKVDSLEEVDESMSREAVIAAWGERSVVESELETLINNAKGRKELEAIAWGIIDHHIINHVGKEGSASWLDRKDYEVAELAKIMEKAKNNENLIRRAKKRWFEVEEIEDIVCAIVDYDMEEARKNKGAAKDILDYIKDYIKDRKEKQKEAIEKVLKSLNR